jgi:hypothetical protein
MDFKDSIRDPWLNMVKTAYDNNYIKRGTLKAGVKNRCAVGVTVWPSLPERSDFRIGEIQPGHARAFGNQVLGGLAVSAHCFQDIPSGQIDPREHWLINEPVSILQALRIAVMSLVS